MFMWQGCANCDPVRLRPEPLSLAPIESMQVTLHTRRDIDVRGVLPVNPRRLRRRPRFMLPARVSPIAKIPGTLVSSKSGGCFSGQRSSPGERGKFGADDDVSAVVEVVKGLPTTPFHLHVDNRPAQSSPLRQTCNALYILSVIRSTQQLIGRYTRKPPSGLLP